MMFWQDVLLGCRVPDAELRNALAIALGVPASRVRIVDAIHDSPAIGDGAPLLIAERASLEGEFPLHVSLYVKDPLVEQRSRSSVSSLERLSRLCGLLQCAALVSDEALDPASWLRIQPSGLIERVLLDPDHLDRDEYVVATATPASLSFGSAV
jgi:hypothetical protein